MRYTTPPVTAEDQGSLFAVTVSNPGGSVTSNSAMLSVNLPPSIITQPADTTVQAGQAARFSVVATGKLPLSYEWMKNGAPITGATKATYKTPRTTPGDSGSVFTVTVTNSLGMITSDGAVLTVN